MIALSLFFIACFLGGAAFGSFAKLAWDRRGRGLWVPFSHCIQCGKRLPWRYKIPVFSYLGLSGRCGFCGSRLPGSGFWIELASGLAGLGLAGWWFWRAYRG